MAEKVQVEDLTLPVPSLRTADQDDHARERQEHRAEILGADAYKRDQELVSEARNSPSGYASTDVLAGAPAQEREENFQRANDYKDRVVNRTQELVNRATNMTNSQKKETDANATNPSAPNTSADIQG